MPRFSSTFFPAILAMVVLFSMPRLLWGQFDCQWVLPISDGPQEALFIHDAATTKGGDILLTGSIKKSAPQYSNPFLAKISSNGKLAWFYEIPGRNNDNGWAIATNETGDIYITGDMVTGLAPDFTDDGINDLKTTKGTEVFVAAYRDNGADIRFKWATNYPAKYSEVHGISTDNSGNVVISGSFQTEMTIGQQSHLIEGQSGAFLISLKDRDTTSSLNWGYTFGGLKKGERAFGSGVTTDDENNVYYSGYFEKAIDLGPISDSVQLEFNAPDIQGFLAKYTPDGNPVWAHHLKGGSTGRSNPTHITCGPDDNIYLTGHYSRKLEFPGGQTTLISSDFDIFLASFDKDGTINWASSHGNPAGGNDFASGISVDVFGNIAVPVFTNTTAQNVTLIHTNAHTGSIQGHYPLLLDQGTKFNFPEAGDALFHNGQLYLTGIYQHEAAVVSLPGDSGERACILPANTNTPKGFVSKYDPILTGGIKIKCPVEPYTIFLKDGCTASLPNLAGLVSILAPPNMDINLEIRQAPKAGTLLPWGGPHELTFIILSDTSIARICTLPIMVKDTAPVVARCRDAIVYLDINGQGVLDPRDIYDVDGHGCVPLTLQVDKPVFSCSDLRAASDKGFPRDSVQFPVILTLTNSNRQSASCKASVTLQAGPSNANYCGSISLQLNRYGKAVVTINDFFQPGFLSGGGTDGTSIISGRTEFDCRDAGKDFILALGRLNCLGTVDTCYAVVSVNDDVVPCCAGINAVQVLQTAGSANDTDEANKIVLGALTHIPGPINYSFNKGQSWTEGGAIFQLPTAWTSPQLVQVRYSNGCTSAPVEVVPNKLIAPQLIAPVSDSFQLSDTPIRFQFKNGSNNFQVPLGFRLAIWEVLPGGRRRSNALQSPARLL